MAFSRAYFLNQTAAAALMLAFSGEYAFAQIASPYANQPRPEIGTQVDTDEPVLLTANQVDYDSASKLVIAEGRVEVTQGDTILLADTLAYDQANNVVFAIGNVSVLESTGNVYFADQAELTDDMKEAVIGQFKARLADNSLFAASEAHRINEDVTELKNAVYSPCSILCDDGVTTKEPLWQIKADKVRIDQQKQKVTYRDAYFDLYGFPVLYTPYLSHAMPGADNKSGMLFPTYRRDDNLGFTVKLPIYYAIAPDKDLTLTPMYTSFESPALFAEYRQMYDVGGMKFDGSFTRPNDIDSADSAADGKQFRGHIFAKGDFTPSNTFDWGFNIRRTSDDTYLRRYDINYDPLLTSRAYAEQFNFLGDSDRTYAAAQAFAFQGLQQQNATRNTPYVFPMLDFDYQGDPLTRALNSRMSYSANMLALMRDEGTQSRRVSGTARWAVPLITDGGHVFEAAGQLRADGYSVENVTQQDGTMFDGTRARVLPQASVTWRYPLINRFEKASWMIEPVAMVIASPSGNDNNTNRIPNEDSAIPEFTDTNLFSENRFAGYDRVETGPRANYGMRTQVQFAESNAYLNGIFGQSYRTQNDPLFPLSNDLRSRFSDYVGRVGFSYAPVEVAYRFRLDKDSFANNRRELEANLGLKRFSFGTNYLRLEDDPILASKEEISAYTTLKLTEHWQINAGTHRDLLRKQMTNFSAGLTYQNDCITVVTSAGRDYTSDRDFRQSTSFTVQLFLKNLN